MGNFFSSKDKLSNKDYKSENKVSLKTRLIDLHGYTLDQANKTIEEFIISSYKKKINKLVVVTGKGLHSKNDKNPYVSKDLSILSIQFLNLFQLTKNW